MYKEMTDKAERAISRKEIELEDVKLEIDKLRRTSIDHEK